MWWAEHINAEVVHSVRSTSTEGPQIIKEIESICETAGLSTVTQMDAENLVLYMKDYESVSDSLLVHVCHTAVFWVSHKVVSDKTIITETSQ